MAANGDRHGFRATVTRIARSGRVYGGLTTNALSSLGNFAISIALARTLGLGELGEFALAFAVYAFCAGFVRASVCEPLLAVEATDAELRRVARRASLIGIIASAIVIVLALLLSLDYLVLLGLCIHGLSIFDYSKTMHLAAFKRRVAIVQEVAWFIFSVAAGVLVVAGVIPGFVGFIVWCSSGAIIGYISAINQGLGMLPIWQEERVSPRTVAAFGGDYIIGSGSAQISFNLVGVAGGLGVLGAVRAGGTLLGPIGLVVGSARTLAIPFLTRRIRAGAAAARTGALAATTIIALVSAPLLVVIAFLPAPLGRLLLAENWEHAAPLLPFLALEMFFIALTTVPFAGMRSLQAGRASVILRSGLAFVRVAGVPIAAGLGGAFAAVVALACVGALGTAVWWIGYLFLLRYSTEGAS